MRSVLPSLAAVLAAVVAGCGGGGDDLIEEGSLRDCLAEEELSIEVPEIGESAGLGNVSPDFRAVTKDGAGIEVVVQGNEQKAERTAADISGALASFGATGSEVVSERNAIVIFEESPADPLRASVEGCLS
jgi:hypothetical protein